MGLFSTSDSNKMSINFTVTKPKRVGSSKKDTKKDEKRAQKEANTQKEASAQKEAKETAIREKYIEEEFVREKMRQTIRDKYGIKKKSPTMKSEEEREATLEKLRNEYGMGDDFANQLKKKMDQNAAEQKVVMESVEQKMKKEKRRKRSELKNDKFCTLQ